jgi:hypothetical protein
MSSSSRRAECGSSNTWAIADQWVASMVCSGPLRLL